MRESEKELEGEVNEIGHQGSDTVRSVQFEGLRVSSIRFGHGRDGYHGVYLTNIL